MHHRIQNYTSPSVCINAFLPRTNQACRQMWRYWRLRWSDIRKFWWRKSGSWSGKCSQLARRSSVKLQPCTRKSQNCLWFQTLFKYFQQFSSFSSGFILSACICILAEYFALVLYCQVGVGEPCCCSRTAESAAGCCWACPEGGMGGASSQHPTWRGAGSQGAAESEVSLFFLSSFDGS